MKTFLFSRYLKWTLLSTFSGFLAGASSSIFLTLLSFVTQVRIDHPQIIWALPFAGFFVAWLYHFYGKREVEGVNLIIDEIQRPSIILSMKMAPLVVLGTLLTHLFGGSAGREGTALQIGAALSDQLSRIFKVSKEERRILLVAGAGSGFGSAVGAPWAGVVFGLEFLRVGKLKVFALLECVTASIAAYLTTLAFGIHLTNYPAIEAPYLQWRTLAVALVAGIVFGFAARIFIAMTHTIESIQKSLFTFPPYRSLFGGVLLAMLFSFEDLRSCSGLGLSTIQNSFLSHVSFAYPALKTLLTSLTLGSGLKGGEFTPLVFIGSTLGSSLSEFFPLDVPVLACMGLAAVFAGAANAPLACSVMASELFGLHVAPFVHIACYSSYFV